MKSERADMRTGFAYFFTVSTYLDKHTQIHLTAKSVICKFL